MERPNRKEPTSPESRWLQANGINKGSGQTGHSSRIKKKSAVDDTSEESSVEGGAGSKDPRPRVETSSENYESTKNTVYKDVLKKRLVIVETSDESDVEVTEKGNEETGYLDDDDNSSENKEETGDIEETSGDSFKYIKENNNEAGQYREQRQRLQAGKSKLSGEYEGGGNQSQKKEQSGDVAGSSVDSYKKVTGYSAEDKEDRERRQRIRDYNETRKIATGSDKVNDIIDWREQVTGRGLMWVYDSDTSNDSILLAGPVFKKRPKENIAPVISKRNKMNRATGNTEPKVPCPRCDHCVCCRNKTTAEEESPLGDDEVELEILAELRWAVQNSEVHNNMVESLQRKIRAVRIRRWRVREDAVKKRDWEHEEEEKGQTEYDDVNIGDIKRRDRNNVDGFNQSTLTQMYSQLVTADGVVDGSTKDQQENEPHETDEDHSQDSDGTLFVDYSCNIPECQRYENGTGPLWQAHRFSPYDNPGLDDLCRLWADLEK
jgi:hypothetical protein